MKEKGFFHADLDPADLEKILERIEENLVLRPLLREGSPAPAESGPSASAEAPPIEVNAVEIYRRVQGIKELQAPLFIPKDNGAGGLVRRGLNLVLRLFGHKQIGFNRDILDVLALVAGQLQAIKSHVSFQTDLTKVLHSQTDEVGERFAELREQTRILTVRQRNIDDSLQRISEHFADLGQRLNQNLEALSSQWAANQLQLRSQLESGWVDRLDKRFELARQQQAAFYDEMLEPARHRWEKNIAELQDGLANVEQQVQDVHSLYSQLQAEQTMTQQHFNDTRAEPITQPQAGAIYLGDHVALAKTIYGRKIYVSTHDISLAPHILLDGYWEQWIAAVFQRTIEKGMTVVDVGANIGYYTLLAADLVGASGKVYSFEPDPEMFSLLYRSVCVNGFLDRVEPVNIAVMSQVGRMPFNKFRMFQGSSGFYAGSEIAAQFQDSVQQFDVDTTSLDQYMLTKTPRVDVIKIDAEGAEPDIIAGAKALLAHSPPPKIFMEYMPAYYSTVEALIADGFRIHVIDVDATVKPVSLDLLADQKDWVMLYIEK